MNEPDAEDRTDRVRAHTDPDLFARWCGPDDLTMRIEHFDARRGGAYRYVHSRGEDEYAFVVSLVRGAVDHRDALDERIGDAAKNWRVERMALLDRLVMRLAIQELLSHRESPPRVVISEAIELARAYSGEEAAKFVNGVLDGAFKRLKDEGLVRD